MRAARARALRAAAGTTPPGSWARCWRWCSACSRCSRPIALDLRPGDADGQIRRQFLLAIGIQRVRVPRRASAARRARGLRARRSAGQGRRAGAGACAHPPHQTTRQARSGHRRRRRARSPPTARRSAAFRARWTCRPAIARSPSRRRAISITSSASPSPAAARSSSSRWRSSHRSESSASARCPRARRSKSTAKPAGVTPAKVEMDAGIRRVQVSSPGLRAVDLERRGRTRARRRPSAPSNSARPMRASPCARCPRARR